MVVKSKAGLSGKLTLRTWRDGVMTGERVAENIVCLNGLSDLAAAMAWSAAQDQGSQIGAVSNFLTPVYGAVGTGTNPPYALTGAVAAGSTIVQPYSPAPVTVVGTVTVSSPTSTSIASTTGIVAGMTLTDVAGQIPAGTTVLSTTSTTITMSANGLGTQALDSVTAGYNFIEGMVVADTAGLIPAYSLAITNASNEITMSEAAIGSTLSIPAALDTVTTGTTSVTTHTVDVTNGALIVVVVGNYNGGAPALGISDTLGGLAWTTVSASNATSFAGAAICYATATSTIDGTITVTNTSGTAMSVQPWQITGQAAVGATVTAGTSNGTLSAAPYATSMIFSVASDYTAGASPVDTVPNGFSSLMANQQKGNLYTSAAYQLGSAYQALAWITSGAVGPSMVAIEIQPALNSTILVGTSNADTQLGAELTRTQVSAVAASPATGAGSTTLLQFQFPANAADFVITEAGVFVLADSGTNDGDMLDHCVFSPAFTWSTGDTMTLSAEFIWNFP